VVTRAALHSSRNVPGRAERGEVTRTRLRGLSWCANPRSDKAAVIYTDDTIQQKSSGAPLPQVVLAQQK